MATIQLKKIFFPAIIILAAFSIIYFILSQRVTAPLQLKIDGTYLPHGQKTADFSLINHDGKLFTEKNLPGHWTMMFFGFTYCGMVCPTTLEALNRMYRLLQQELPGRLLPQVVFVSVDPDRDPIERIKEYLNTFNPNFLGVRAENIEKTIELEKKFHVVAAKIQNGQGKNEYTINHSAEILLINPRAEIQAYFSYPHDPEQMAKDYKLILQTAKG